MASSILLIKSEHDGTGMKLTERNESSKPSHGRRTPGIDEVMMKLRTAIKLLEDGMPNFAESWAFQAENDLHAENERRRAAASELRT